MSEASHSDIGKVEFTLDWYREYLRRLQAADYRFQSFSAAPEPGDVFLRHDVDLSVEAALETARIEADLGATATYMFLLTSPLYNPFESETRERIHRISALGHDVCLHFSTHQYWPQSDPPGEDELVDRITSERDALASVLDTGIEPTVSFHIPPDWVLDRRFEGIPSTYAPEFFSEIGYCADSGQRWRDDAPAIEALPGTAQMLTHPGLWRAADEPFERRIERAIDDATSHTRSVATMEFVRDVYS